MTSSFQNKNLSLYATGQYSLHPSCEWSFKTNTSGQMNLKFERSTTFSEDIYLKVQSDSGFSEYLAKDFSNWETGVTSITIKDANLITLRVKRLSDSSNYRASVSYSDSQSMSSQFLVILFTTLISLLVIGLGAALIFSVIYWRYREYKRNQRFLEILNAEEIQQRDMQREKEIEQTLEKMTSGTYGDTKIEYEQTKCVICLSEFTSDSQILITNECHHVFHDSWLKSWYCRISSSKPLTCPHCLAPNGTLNIQKQKINSEGEGQRVINTI